MKCFTLLNKIQQININKPPKAYIFRRIEAKNLIEIKSNVQQSASSKEINPKTIFNCNDPQWHNLYLPPP